MKTFELRQPSMILSCTLYNLLTQSWSKQVNLTGGVDLGTGCSGSILPNKRLNFPGMCVSDAGNGLRNTDFVNAYPAGIHVGTR